VDGATYVDECPDGSGLIPDLNRRFGVKGWTLMQDGASAHTCAATMQYLNRYINVLANWPSGSPDMNPIENLWAIMKARVSEVGAETVDDLIDIIVAVWEALTPTELANLTNSMQARFAAVIAANGGQTNY
jgi:hypothetical protein